MCLQYKFRNQRKLLLIFLVSMRHEGESVFLNTSKDIFFFLLYLLVYLSLHFLGPILNSL